MDHDMQFKRNVTIRDADGNRHALGEYVKLIGTTTALTPGEISEGNRRYYYDQNGRLFAASDPYGRILLEGTDVELWLVE